MVGVVRGRRHRVRIRGVGRGRRAAWARGDGVAGQPARPAAGGGAAPAAAAAGRAAWRAASDRGRRLCPRAARYRAALRPATTQALA